MTRLPELHDALERAVAARAASAKRRRVNPSRRAGLLALGGVVFAGSAVAATTAVWHPTLGSDRVGHPQVAHAAVPATQLSALGVLRRPQTAGDRGPDVQRLLHLLTGGQINGVHTDAIRVLRRNADGMTLLVPAERAGNRRFASTIQHDALCLLTSTRTRTTIKRGSRGKLYLGSSAGAISAGQTCGTLRDVQTTDLRTGAYAGNDLEAIGLVPDGVARVVVRLRHRRERAATVHGNVYVVNTGSELAPGWGVRWLDAEGRRIAHRRNR
jgi:hypothetical protein